MNAKEKRLLKMAAIIFLAGFIPFKAAPSAWKYINDEWKEYKKLKQDIAYFTTIKERAEFWKQENERIKKEREDILAKALPGRNQELIHSKMENRLRELSQSVGFSVQNWGLPDFFQTGNWVLITKEIQFRQANPATLLRFLKAVDNVPEYLSLLKLDIRSNRNQLDGSVRISGFAYLPPPETSENTTDAS